MTLLAVQGLNKAFKGVVAARDVSFEVAPGEMVALIGPNGAGKSTTFNMVGGQLAPDSGRVLLDGTRITGLAPRAIWRKGIARTFQIAQTFLSMSVAENVQMALISARGRTRALFASARPMYREEALAILAALGMADEADRPVSQLAYGDVKSVELAIALASEPKLLLMDEPTAGMAPSERAALMKLVARLAKERKIGVLFTEHDIDAVFAHASHVLVLMRGEIIARGPPAEVRADKRVQQVYLGTSDMAGTLRRCAAKAVSHA
jgi:branched-chain amino acid transport system ATP-binding protein